MNTFKDAKIKYRNVTVVVQGIRMCSLLQPYKSVPSAFGLKFELIPLSVAPKKRLKITLVKRFVLY